MKTRIITSVVGLAFLALVLVLFDTVVFDLVLAAVCLLGMHEVFNAMGFTKKEWYLYAAAVPYTLLIMLASRDAARALVLPASFLLLLFLNICLITHCKTLDFGRMSGYLYFSGVILICFYSLIYLKRCLPVQVYQFDAVFFIALTLCFAWGGDSAAYFAGRAWGKHKLSPVVSPHKTVEGAIGGVIGSMVLGLFATAIYSVISGRFTTLTVSVSMRHYLLLALMGGIASVLGILGDLFASAVKRQMGIKDYGTIFPGHGGILDRFDSVMFIAPFVAIVVRHFFYL
ncbi:MAG: phosphatidate cytidylyltransferase [Gemmiger sp.]|nr:phosphatidate cytidylyltransferase [Gemmiger sp.]